MSYDDFDSDGAATGERRYTKPQSNYRSSSNQKASILKNSSSLRKSTQFSDDEEDTFTTNSGRLSNRNRLGNNDSPLNSYRSDSNAGKPPSGRLMPLQPMSTVGLSRDVRESRDPRETRDGRDSRSEYKETQSKKSLPAISYKNSNDSDDAYTDNRFTKKSNFTNDSKYDRFDVKNDSSSMSKYDRFDHKNESNYDKSIDSKYDRFDMKTNDKYDRFDIPISNTKLKPKSIETNKYDKFDDNNTNYSIKNKDKFDKFENKYDSKFDSKYDTYDEDDIKKHSDMSNKYFRSEGPLKVSSKSDPLDSLDLYSKGITPKNQRSNSLDRIHSAYNQILNTNTLASSSGGRLSKFNSTSNLNGIDNSSDRSYTVTSLTSTNLSIKEAKSRSYLVGSLSAINGKGLLSSEELERNLVEKRARILVATWNMGGTKKLSDNLDELLLPEMIQTMPDIYVIGVEEFELSQKDWEISLQEQIGPAHVKFTSYYYGSIGICVFIKRELIWFCSIAEFEHINLRAGPINTPNATKASILVSFQLFGTLMCFICSHFSSGEGNIEHRIENYKTTINNIKLPNKLLTKNRLLATDGTDNFDCVFWFGDFNFRVDKERGKVVDKIADMRKKKSMNYEDLMNHDELYRVIDEDKAFKNFLEGRITFEPTYKYELNSDEYDRSEKCRIPSYTDRILYRSRQKGIISCSFYDAVKEIKVSDHRPVYGVYEVTIRPGVDTIPLSYGEFDRQVYQAGYQKRQMFRACDVGFNSKTIKNKKSSPCSIQ